MKQPTKMKKIYKKKKNYVQEKRESIKYKHLNGITGILCPLQNLAYHVLINSPIMVWFYY